MADYHSPTTVQPDIPIAAMTALELRLLCELFESERDDSTIYLFASENVADNAWINRAELQALLDAGDERPSAIADVVRAELAANPSDDEEFELDFSLIGYDRIFQDIVRRSSDLDHIQIVAAWTCTRMRPDGFGGMATVITADAVESMSTASFIEGVLARLADP